MVDSVMFPVDDHIPHQMLKKYNRTEKALIEDVDKLKEWMKTQIHLPEILDDHRIRNFLLLNKCSVEKSKKKIDTYYTIKSQIPEMFENTNPKDLRMKMAMETIYYFPLPKLTEQMYRVFMFKVRNKNLLDKLNPLDIIGHILNVHEIRLKEDHVFGDVFIADYNDINWEFLVKLTPSVVAKVYAVYKKAYSVSMKALYIINSSSSINSILTILKAVVNPKFFSRIFVCNSHEDVYEALSKEMLPSDYGGSEKSCEKFRETVLKKFVEYEVRFDELDKMKVDENFRPLQLKNDQVLGFHGNFKKLEVD